MPEYARIMPEYRFAYLPRICRVFPRIRDVSAYALGHVSHCGCMFAHKLALQKIAGQRERMIVLEDDAVDPDESYETVSVARLTRFCYDC